jgi:hypothetical protein
VIRGRAVAAALVLSGFRTVGAEPCAPRASLDGDAEAVAKVAAELARLGDAIGDAPRGCRAVTAAVEVDRGGGIAVAVRDSSKRSEGRVVSDAVIAAAWIDTWLHDDFEVPAAEPTPMHVDTVVTAPPAADPFSRFAIAASYELAWTDTSTSWSGFGVSACMRVGELCIGARARYLTDTESTMLTAASRSDASVLATASWSHDLGTMSIAPEVGLGVGRMTTERADGCATPPACDPSTDPNCPPAKPPPCAPSGGTSIYVGDGFHAATITPRAEAALRIAIPLFEHVWLDGTAAVTLAPFGHGDAYVPAMSPPGTTPGDIALPGDPLATFQIGVGLRVGSK